MLIIRKGKETSGVFSDETAVETPFDGVTQACRNIHPTETLVKVENSLQLKIATECDAEQDFWWAQGKDQVDIWSWWKLGVEVGPINQVTADTSREMNSSSLTNWLKEVGATSN